MRGEWGVVSGEREKQGPMLVSLVDAQKPGEPGT